MFGAHQVNKLKSVMTDYFKRAAHLNIAFLDQGIVSGVNFLTGIIFARLLGLQEYGHFTLIWMAILFINSLQTAMIISPMMSIGSQQALGEEAAYYGAVLLQQLLFTLISLVLVLVASAVVTYFIPQWNFQRLTLPLIAVSLTYQLQEFLRRYFFTRAQVVKALLNDSISYIGQILLVILLAQRADFNLLSVLWAIALTSGVAVAVGFFQLGKLQFNKASFAQVLKRHLDFSKWLTASTLMIWLSGNLMLMTAGMVLSASAVGLLKSCQNIIAVTHIIFNALGNIIPVKMGCYFSAEGIQAMETYFSKALTQGGVLTLLFALPALLIPGLTLKLVYGAEFEQYGYVLFLYGLLYLVMFFNQMMTFALRTLEATKPIFNGYLLTAIVSLLTSYPLIHFYGIIGVVGGMLFLALINCVILVQGYLGQRSQYRQLEGLS